MILHCCAIDCTPSLCLYVVSLAVKAVDGLDLRRGWHPVPVSDSMCVIASVWTHLKRSVILSRLFSCALLVSRNWSTRVCRGVRPGVACGLSGLDETIRLLYCDVYA
ncbi:hypothetical protein BaRGS_00006043 [Batillaria attramentaria]|uniref:Uncharacterized protein n=1 Tax=Batillaria attramentaria TaxID=370345 RepID=A0ABD0LTT7_9CAEN